MKLQLSQWQFMLLLFWGVMGSGIIFLPHLIAHFVTRDAWLSALLILLPVLLLAPLCTAFVRLFPNQTLVESLFQSCGRWLGGALSVWLVAWLFVSTCMFLRKSTLFLEESVLPDTPLYVLAALVAIALAYAVYMGIEVMARMTELLTPLALLVSVTLTALALREAHWQNVTPVLADGWHPVLRGAVLPWRFSLQMLLGLQFASALPNASKTIARNMLVVGLALSGLGMIAELLMVMVLGDQITFNKYPIMEVVKTIQYGEFFQRLDPLYVMGVVMVLTLQLTVFHYAWSVACQKLLKLDSHRRLAWSGAAAVWAGSVLFWRNGTELDHFVVYTSPAYFACTILLLPILAISVQWLRHRWHASSVQPRRR